MENEIIVTAHDQGHFSAAKTQDLVEKSYYIPKFKGKVARVAESCVRCIIVNGQRFRIPLKNIVKMIIFNIYSLPPVYLLDMVRWNGCTSL